MITMIIDLFSLGVFMRNYMYRGFVVSPECSSRIKYNSNFLIGEWIYGGYFFDKDNNRFILDRYSGVIEEVIPETVTQYVDRVDKNSNFIFEKDIVEDDYGRIMVVVWSGYSWCFKLIYCPSSKQKFNFEGSLCICRWDSSKLKILGNIWNLDLSRFSDKRRV